MIEIGPYPTLAPAVFAAEWPAPLDDCPSPAWLTDLLGPDADAPVSRSEEVRAAVRDLLRHRGYKPTGRGKPASEYLVRAATEGTLSPINAAVDACNAVSLHSGLPISVVDLGRATPPFRIDAAEAGASYVFNAAGQEIDVTGLLCLHDAHGPCANPVKDAQRTKTDGATTQTLTILWTPESLADRRRLALAWYVDLLQRLGARVDMWND